MSALADKYGRLGLFTGKGDYTFRDPSEWPPAHRADKLEVFLLKHDGSYAKRFTRDDPPEMNVVISEPGWPRTERVLFSVVLNERVPYRGMARTTQRLFRAVEEFNAALKHVEHPTRWMRFREWLRF